MLKHILLGAIAALGGFQGIPIHTPRPHVPEPPKRKVLSSRRGWYIDEDAEHNRATRQAKLAAEYAANPMNFLPNRIRTKIYGKYCGNPKAMQKVAAAALAEYLRNPKASPVI